MIAAYSPQARGRSERSFGTWQGRPPQELRLRGISDVEQANESLRSGYIAAFDSRFAIAATQKGMAFVRSSRRDLDWVFSTQQERTASKMNFQRRHRASAAHRGQEEYAKRHELNQRRKPA